MIQIPIIKGGSWYTSSERKVRSLFNIKLINNQPNANTKEICEKLKFHLEHNKGFSVNSSADSQYTITLIDENNFVVDGFQGEIDDFKTLEQITHAKFNSYLMKLASKDVNSCD